MDNLSVSVEKPKTVNNFRCDECNIDFTGFQTEQRFKEHMKIEHDQKKPFKCDQCDFRSARVYGLSVHVVQKHTDEKPWACDQCDFRTKMKQSLKVHKQTIHEEVKLFKCELCSYEANTNHQLKDHMNTHTGARPYKCDKCDYTGKVLKVSARMWFLGRNQYTVEILRDSCLLADIPKIPINITENSGPESRNFRN